MTERNTYGTGPEPTGCIVFVVPMINCDFCNIGFELEDIFEVDGHKLCMKCKRTYHEQMETKRIEDQIQHAMNELPTDQLLTLELAFSIAIESMGESSDVPENVSLWAIRAKEALALKKNQSTIGTSPVTINKTTSQDENTKRLHA